MVMAGLERPDSGEVVVSGTPFNALDEDALARFRGRQVGIVFQSFHLIPTMTALENVAVPLELAGNPDASARAAQELNSVGLGDRLHHYPTQLSGGEQQRVALARALAPDPAILVADEPTGNLDEATGKQIVDLLFTKHAERGMTLVLVTHDTSLAQRCDRVVRLRSGRIDTALWIAKPLYDRCFRISDSRPRGMASASLCAARIARRLARLLRLHRLYRARRDGDRRGRLGRRQPQRGTGA